ncbi:T9SS type A sorting domain-containing protein [Flavobacterium sp. N1719]|uniref:T9SS type A sorting domain-containing protein n=1 Tax=Flavobacterium sp. N1719 TaxID=2885633 RepID=UPI002222F854|nr:T9SS type A sorting domain-containing protein [Flavobacterium sp. N1719]
MKKTTLLLLALPLLGIAQSKGTNPISVQNLNAGMVLNNDTQTVTLTMVGPSDRWIAIQYGQFTGGMQNGSDMAYFNGTTLVDGRMNGSGQTPSADAQNNWTVTQNTVNSGVRTLIATRPFDSPDATDYDFNYADQTIAIGLARANGASFTLSNHGTANRIMNTTLGFTNLGTTELVKETTRVYPNPSQGNVTISSESDIQSVAIYQLNGALVRTIRPETASTQLEVSGLSTGSYLLEIQSNSEKIWKKIVVE